jgi:hypothetical protein
MNRTNRFANTVSALVAAASIFALGVTPVFAQDANSTANSGSTAGSVSGASNNNSTTNGPQTTTVAPVNNGNGDSRSTANSNASTSSVSGSYSAGGAGGASDSRSTATGGNSTASGGSSQATNGTATSGNAQNINFNTVTPTHTTAEVKSVPTVYAPALTTTLTETCMGSSSASGAGMGFGFALGSTWHDKDCVRRLNAREMAQTLGDREAARALLCEDDNVRKAYESVGEPCNVPATPKSAASYPSSTYSAPIAPQPVPDDSKMAPIPNPPANSGERGSLPSNKHAG